MTFDFVTHEMTARLESGLRERRQRREALTELPRGAHGHGLSFRPRAERLRLRLALWLLPADARLTLLTDR